MEKKQENQDLDNLLKRLSAADETAFREIYDRYGKTVYKAALRYLRSEDFAKDIVQEVFCALWDKREHFLHVKSLEGYLVTMTHHQIYRLFRKLAAESKNQNDYLQAIDHTIDDADFDIRAQQYEDILHVLVGNLPPQQRQVFRMAREEGMTHEAIARELNISPGTVKNHMVRALNYIRKNLIPHVTTIVLANMIFK